MRQDADVRHAGRGGATQIVKMPSRNHRPLIQRNLPLRPSSEAAFWTFAENVVTGLSARLRLQDFRRQPAQGKIERPSVFHSRCGQTYDRLVKVDFLPGEPADFLA